MSSPYILPEYSSFEKEYNEVVQCNRCGFCETSCPTYVVSGKETLSPRGRNQALRQILEGKITNPAQAEEIFSSCLTCYACTNACFSQVPVAKLMAHARSIVNEKKKLNLADAFVFRYLLINRKLFSLFMWIGFLFKRAGVSSLLNKLGILKLISPELSAAEDLVKEVPLKFGGAPAIEAPANSPEKQAAYFSGCGIYYLYPKAHNDCIKVLSRSAGKPLCPSHDCCGLPAHSSGNISSAKRMAEKVVDRFERLGSSTVVVNDDSCAGFMKSYGELLGDSPKAHSFSKKVKDLAEFLEESKTPAADGLPPGRPALRATYHDPCQMGNAHQKFDPARNILKKLPGINFVEMEESNWCCGGAGTYCLKHPNLAEDVLERKLLNIKGSGAELVVTQASSCLLHIQYGLRMKGWDKKIRAVHLGELLAGDYESVGR